MDFILINIMNINQQDLVKLDKDQDGSLISEDSKNDSYSMPNNYDEKSDDSMLKKNRKNR